MCCSSERRVVISGMGLITSVGNTPETFWESVVNGKSGIKTVTGLNPDEYPSKVAGQVSDFDPSDYFDPKEARRMDRFCQFAVVAADNAVKDSNLDMTKEDPARVGVLVGSGIGGLSTIEDVHTKLLKRGPRAVSPFLIPMMIVDLAAGHISIRHGMKGPNLCVVTACATAAHSIGVAFRSIKFGDAEVYVTGGTESAITPLGMGGFCNMNALSTSFNDEPERASRPFDKDRDGFVMSEGAGIIIIEELQHALDRNAPIYGEIMAVGMSGDAYHVAAPEAEGRGAGQAMVMALNQSGVSPSEIEYINSHGTSTPLGDISECLAINRVFGEDNHVMVGSTKSMTGHTLGAAGGIEIIATCLAMQKGIVPPTINNENQDEKCKVDCVPNVAREFQVKTAMSNSFGFGGHNASIIVKKFEG